MAWPTTYPGRTAADFPLAISGGGSISPHLLQRRDIWGEIIKQIAPAVRDYMDKKRADDIANTVLNMEQPPRAQPIDQFGATYDPQLAATQGLYSQTEPQATPPATGGTRRLAALKAYQDFTRQNANDELNRKLKEAQADHYSAIGTNRTTLPRYPVTLDDGSTVYVTGNQALSEDRRRTAPSKDSMAAIDRDIMAETGYHLSDLNNALRADVNDDGSATLTLADGKTQVTMRKELRDSIEARYGALQQRQTPASTLYKQAQGGAAPAPQTTPKPANGEADQIKADYNSGKITREEALAKLRAIGFE